MITAPVFQGFGSLPLAGAPAFLASNAVYAAPGGLSLAGAGASAVIGHAAAAPYGSLSLGGKYATYVLGQAAEGLPGALTLAGVQATTVRGHNATATPGALVLTGVVGQAFAISTDIGACVSGAYTLSSLASPQDSPSDPSPADMADAAILIGPSCLDESESATVSDPETGAILATLTEPEEI